MRPPPLHGAHEGRPDIVTKWTGALPDASNDAALGRRVERATADVLTAAAVPIFTISGRVLLQLLMGEVTTIIAAGTTPEGKFQFNPTVGTTQDLSALLNIASDEVGTIYAIDGTPATAMLRGESGGVRNMQNNGIVLGAGQIEFLCDEDVTGSLKFQARYIPLDPGSAMVAA